MALAKTNNSPLTILGAPRNEHKGIVMTVFKEQPRDKFRPLEQQVGTDKTKHLHVLNNKT